MTINGFSDERISMVSAASRCGLTVRQLSKDTLILNKKGTGIVFHLNSRKLLFNNRLVWLNGPASIVKGNWTVSNCDINNVLIPLLYPKQITSKAKVNTVVIDPGHGGRDTGAIGKRRVYEKKAVLDIARRVRKKLKTADLEVRMTRSWDSNRSLVERTAKARKWEADLFVSIHLNYASNKKACGTETFVVPCRGFPSTSGKKPDFNACSGNLHDPANTLLAYMIQKEILATTGNADRGIKRARFNVIKNAPCPSVLVECAFLSNPAEEAKLIEKDYRDSLAEGIARGILAFAGKKK